MQLSHNCHNPGGPQFAVNPLHRAPVVGQRLSTRLALRPTGSGALMLVQLQQPTATPRSSVSMLGSSWRLARAAAAVAARPHRLQAAGRLRALASSAAEAAR